MLAKIKKFDDTLYFREYKDPPDNRLLKEFRKCIWKALKFCISFDPESLAL
jgi:hypothetical protein